MKQIKSILINKYIYQLNNKFKLFIRSGKYYYSCMCNLTKFLNFLIM